MDSSAVSCRNDSATELTILPLPLRQTRERKATWKVIDSTAATRTAAKTTATAKTTAPVTSTSSSDPSPSTSPTIKSTKAGPHTKGNARTKQSSPGPRPRPRKTKPAAHSQPPVPAFRVFSTISAHPFPEQKGPKGNRVQRKAALAAELLKHAKLLRQSALPLTAQFAATKASSTSATKAPSTPVRRSAILEKYPPPHIPAEFQERSKANWEVKGLNAYLRSLGNEVDQVVWDIEMERMRRLRAGQRRL